MLLSVGCVGPVDPPAPSVAQVARELGCSGLKTQHAPDLEVFVSEQGECRFASDRVRIRTFRNNQFRKDWLVEVDIFRAHFCVKDRTIIWGDKLPTADRIQAVVGGRVQRND